MSYNQIQNPFMSCLLWPQHPTFGIFVYISSFNHDDALWDMNVFTNGEIEAERGNWLVQRSTAASSLATIQTGPWNFKPGVFLFVCFYFLLYHRSLLVREI